MATRKRTPTKRERELESLVDLLLANERGRAENALTEARIEQLKAEAQGYEARFDDLGDFEDPFRARIALIAGWATRIRDMMRECDRAKLGMGGRQMTADQRKQIEEKVDPVWRAFVGHSREPLVFARKQFVAALRVARDAPQEQRYDAFYHEFRDVLRAFELSVGSADVERALEIMSRPGNAPRWDDMKALFRGMRLGEINPQDLRELFLHWRPRAKPQV